MGVMQFPQTSPPVTVPAADPVIQTAARIPARETLSDADTHRTAGRRRYNTVLEVIAWQNHSPVVAAAWGEMSNWYRNVIATPNVTIQIGRRTLDAIANQLTAEESIQVLENYARRYRLAAAIIFRLFTSRRFSFAKGDFDALARTMPLLILRVRAPND